MYYSTEFIVLKRINYSEYDRIITLLSPQRGKITALVKGARKLTSKLAATIELFSYSKGYFVKGKQLDILTQAEIIDPFLTLRSDFTTISKIFYLLELCYTTVQEGQEYKELFTVLLETLLFLQKKLVLPDAGIIFFEMKLLSILGFKPQLYVCTICNQPLTHKHTCCTIVDQGILCPLCSDKQTNNTLHFIKVAPEQLEQIRQLQNISWQQYQECFQNFSQISNIPGIFLQNMIGRKLKTKNYV